MKELSWFLDTLKNSWKTRIDPDKESDLKDQVRDNKYNLGIPKRKTGYNEKNAICWHYWTNPPCEWRPIESHEKESLFRVRFFCLHAEFLFIKSSNFVQKPRLSGTSEWFQKVSSIQVLQLFCFSLKCCATKILIPTLFIRFGQGFQAIDNSSQPKSPLVRNKCKDIGTSVTAADMYQFHLCSGGWNEVPILIQIFKIIGKIEIYD